MKFLRAIKLGYEIIEMIIKLAEGKTVTFDVNYKDEVVEVSLRKKMKQ